MKIKKKKQKSFKNAKNVIGDFLHSDSIPANATKFLLMFIALGGIAVGGAMLPGILKLLKSFNLAENKTGFNKKQISNALGNLKRQKFIELEKYNEDKITVKLTNKGKKRIMEFSFDLLKIKKPRKWDGKWRIVIFDIPNRYKNAREALRHKIKELGLRQLQKSVWIHPFECEDEILFVAEAFEVQRYIEIITAEKLLHGDMLKNYFKDLRQ